MSVQSMLVKSAAAMVLAAPILVTTPSVGAALPPEVSGRQAASVARTWEPTVALG